MYGIPAKRDTIGESEFWLYRFNYGTRTTYNEWTGYNSVNRYDELQLTFNRQGILTNWRASVQR